MQYDITTLTRDSEPEAVEIGREYANGMSLDEVKAEVATRNANREQYSAEWFSWDTHRESED